MMMETSGCIDSTRTQAPQAISGDVAPAYVMAAEVEFACEAAERVVVEHGQPSQPIRIVVAQCPAGTGGAGGSVPRLFDRFGAALIPCAIGIGKAGDGVPQRVFQGGLGVVQFLP